MTVGLKLEAISGGGVKRDANGLPKTRQQSTPSDRAAPYPDTGTQTQTQSCSFPASLNARSQASNGTTHLLTAYKLLFPLSTTDTAANQGERESLKNK